MGKKDSKYKKKSSHKKKKEKKKHKEKKKRHYKERSLSSDSDASTDSSNQTDEKFKSQGELKTFLENIKQQPIKDEIYYDELFSERYTVSREKNESKREKYLLDKPGQSARELNPYWKNGGNGLPPIKKEALSKFERSYDIKFLKILLEKAKDTADATGIPLADIIKEEWGPLEELKRIIEDSENEKLEEKDSNFQQCANLPKQISNEAKEGVSRKYNFLKPGEDYDSDFMNTFNRNWKKKDKKEPSVVVPVAYEKTNLEEKASSGEKNLVTSDELNAMAAKKIKAEIMGNKALAEKIGREIEEAKKNRQIDLDDRGSKEERKEEVVIMRKNVWEKVRKSYENECGTSENKRKRRRGETHMGNERLRFFMDDDKHSLKSMFEREKLSGTEQSNELFIKLAKRGKNFSNNEDSSFDDEFLDRIRCKSYERFENDKERSRTMNEEKEKHKSLSHCRWCLDGNYLQKHLIISVSSKCYLCLPSDKSLTTGHCLIVPAQHVTCRTLLDEDVWNEIDSYRHRLYRMFEEAGQDVVFFENARSFNRFPHMVLHCVSMDKEIGGLAPIYFKKAIMESETEWSHNIKLIDLRKKDLRRSIPKGLPYFAIDFGRDGGFAHVIEDEKLFPSNFAEEVIGGMLDLDVVNWRNRRQESLEAQKEKVKEFLKRWKKYEDSESKLVSTSTNSEN